MNSRGDKVAYKRVYVYLNSVFHSYSYIFLCVAEESVLLDLKHLLIEAKQKVPPFLAALESENEKYLKMGGKMLILHSFTHA